MLLLHPCKAKKFEKCYFGNVWLFFKSCFFFYYTKENGLLHSAHFLKNLDSFGSLTQTSLSSLAGASHSWCKHINALGMFEKGNEIREELSWKACREVSPPHQMCHTWDVLSLFDRLEAWICCRQNVAKMLQQHFNCRFVATCRLYNNVVNLRRVSGHSSVFKMDRHMTIENLVTIQNWITHANYLSSNTLINSFTI